MAKRHYKVDEFLQAMTPEDRAGYEELLRDPTRTVDDALDWLLERGFEIGRSSVARHKMNFDQVLESVRRSSEMAASFSKVAKEGDASTLSDATLTRFQQILMDRLMNLDEDSELDGLELKRLSEAVKNGAATKAIVVKYLAEKFDKEVAKLTTERRSITPDDIAAVRKAMFG